MKDYLKSVGAVVYFMFAQIISCLGIVIYKIASDNVWCEEVYNCISTEGILSKEYFSLVAEILFPTLVLADILVIIPFIVKAVRNKEHICRKIPVNNFVLLVCLGVALNAVISIIVDKLPDIGHYDSLTNIITSGSFGLILLSSGILAPVIEELIFRYFIINLFKDKSIKKAIFVSSFLFGLAHMNIIQSSYAFVLGLVLGYIYVRTEFNLSASILVHLVINSTSILYEYAGSNMRMYMIIGVVICLFVLAGYIYKWIWSE